MKGITDADASGDFETYSEAGYVWVSEANNWTCLPGASQNRKGLSIVNTCAYAEHHTTEVLTFSYTLPLGWRTTPRELWPSLYPGPKQRWRPGLPNPQDLFDYLAAGGTLEAFNIMFEYMIWKHVCERKYGWPPIDAWVSQLRCAMAKMRINALPGGLDAASTVLKLPTPKDKDGKRLLDKFSVPRKPTKLDQRTRIRPEDDPEDFAKLEQYCDTDLDAEHGASMHPIVQPMSVAELQFWFIDQEINRRGIAIDREAVRNCIAILNAALAKYGDECRALTGFDPGQLAELRGWLHGQGVHLDDMREETVDGALDRLAPHPPGGCWPPRRVLEIRSLIGSAAVKKLFAMENQCCADDRLRNMIIHHGARTGRPTGEGPQPLNMPRGGPTLRWCGACFKVFKPAYPACPWCATPATGKPIKWPGVPKDFPADHVPAVDQLLAIIATRSLELIEYYFGDALLCISGCLRGLFVSRPGYDLICSDFNSIEAVAGAELAGEQWRIQAFRDNKPIYLLAAADITGKTVEYYEAYKDETGEHHPDRQTIGKINELANLYGGWIYAFRSMGSNESDRDKRAAAVAWLNSITDDNIKQQILTWRSKSPMVVEMWGGQWRGTPWNGHAELFGFEGMAVQAIQYPGVAFEYRGIRFCMRGAALIITLLSGRELTYHDARLTPSTRDHHAPGELSITYWTWNTNPKYGPMGWVIMSTYGGKLTENIDQAVSHDILRYAITNLRAAGYPTVLHVYDEIICEIPHGTGSLAEFERIMATMPPWAADWPIRATGGWRGHRYRKA